MWCQGIIERFIASHGCVSSIAKPKLCWQQHTTSYWNENELGGSARKMIMVGEYSYWKLITRSTDIALLSRWWWWWCWQWWWWYRLYWSTTAGTTDGLWCAIFRTPDYCRYWAHYNTISRKLTLECGTNLMKSFVMWTFDNNQTDRNITNLGDI